MARVILSIDDSRSVHAFLDRCLQDPALKNSGISLVHAMGVKEGLAILSEDPRICGVLLDWEMPELTGLEGLPLILAARPGTPVIMMTTKNEPDDIAKALELGAAEYIMKPFTPDIFLEKLNAVVGG